MKPFLLLSSVLTVLVAVACSTASCPMDTVVTCNYSFYNADGEQSPLYDTLTVTIRKDIQAYVYRKTGKNDTILRQRSTVLIDSGYTESVESLSIDTILLNRKVNATSMSIPMSYYRSVDTLVFHYGKILLPDTVWLFHTGYTHVETPECGSYRFHNLSEIRTTDRCIDRATIADPSVNYQGNVNLNIYFNTNNE